MFTGTRAQALERLGRMTASDQTPALSTDELSDLLDDARRADRYHTAPDAYDTWAASSAYAVGAEVVPTVRNGHYYTVTVSDGLSGATEPVWPTTSGATVTADGVTYQESGSASWQATWDLNAAAADGWELKAGKASNTNQFLRDARGDASDYTYLNCRRMAEQYRNKIVGSVRVASRRRVINPEVLS